MKSKRTLGRAFGVIAITAFVGLAIAACDNQVTTTPTPTHDCGRDGHIWGNWVTASPATCTTTGVQTRTCQHPGCGHADTPRNYPPELGHSMGDWFMTIQPTPTTAGERRRNCQREGCDHHDTDVVSPEHDCERDEFHLWSGWELTTPPTCTAPGVRTRECQHPDCDQYHTEYYPPALGHDLDDDGWKVTTAPTCTTTGIETRYCGHTACEHYETRPLYELGHDFGDGWEVTTPPTTTTEGVETKKCRRADCNHYETRPIPRLGTGAFSIIFADFHRMSPITVPEPLHIVGSPEETSRDITVDDPGQYQPGSIRWMLGGTQIADGIRGTNGETLTVDSRIHGNMEGSHTVTVVVTDMDGVTWSQRITFTVLR